jgi:uracil-DNA glycosylase
MISYGAIIYKAKMSAQIPTSWQSRLEAEIEKPYFHELQQFVTDERSRHTVFPPEEDVYNALELTSYKQVKVLILGQDPYHDDQQAHGLCFSVQSGIKPPPSLKNIFRELRDDVGFRIPNNGYLVPWAKQGILLLNAVLTVRAHQANSHKGKGWEVFTDAIIEKVAAKKDPVIFVLWGSYAQKKNQLVDTARHIIISSAHPSPLSARRGFFGSRPFSQINKALQDNGNKPIDWQLPDI